MCGRGVAFPIPVQAIPQPGVDAVVGCESLQPILPDCFVRSNASDHGLSYPRPVLVDTIDPAGSHCRVSDVPERSLHHVAQAESERGLQDVPSLSAHSPQHL